MKCRVVKSIRATDEAFDSLWTREGAARFSAIGRYTRYSRTTRDGVDHIETAFRTPAGTVTQTMRRTRDKIEFEGRAPLRVRFEGVWRRAPGHIFLVQDVWCPRLVVWKIRQAIDQTVRELQVKKN